MDGSIVARYRSVTDGRYLTGINLRYVTTAPPILPESDVTLEKILTQHWAY